MFYTQCHLCPFPSVSCITEFHANSAAPMAGSTLEYQTHSQAQTYFPCLRKLEDAERAKGQGAICNNIKLKRGGDIYLILDKNNLRKLDTTIGMCMSNNGSYKRKANLWSYRASPWKGLQNQVSNFISDIPPFVGFKDPTNHDNGESTLFICKILLTFSCRI